MYELLYYTEIINIYQIKSKPIIEKYVTNSSCKNIIMDFYKEYYAIWETVKAFKKIKLVI